ncbi:MAG: D-inositol-3-phosphate glycosyltransferase [Propionibacteriaceae bacterium]
MDRSSVSEPGASSRRGLPSRVAMISLHTSPLETPGFADAGGLNVYVDEVARRLGARGVDVDVYTRRRSPDQPDQITSTERVTVHHVTAGPARPVPKEQLPGLVDAFADGVRDRWDRSGLAPDLVHSHYWLSGLAGEQLGRTAGLPLVHTMHTMARVKNLLRGVDHSLEPQVRIDGEVEIVASADVLTANTTDEARQLRECYDARPAQIAIVPPGVDLSVFHPCDQPKSRAQLGFAPDAQVILFVGRVQRLKAPDVLIRAVARLLAERPGRRDRLQLVIVGSPSGPESTYQHQLRQLIVDHRLHDVVSLHPHAPRTELFRWYCASDVVGVPSYNESFGLVALEAQACGRPVLAHDVGGLRHAVVDGETGELVSGHDPEVWASALAALLDDPARAGRLGRRASLHAATFSWDNSVAALVRAYDAALARH